MKLSHFITIFAGGPGSGCNPKVAVPGCGRPAGDKGNHGPYHHKGVFHDLVLYETLKKRWTKINNRLLAFVDKPHAPKAKQLMNSLKNVVKQMYTLNVDPGGWKGIGLPGGPKDILIVGAGPGGLASATMAAADGLDTMIVEAQPNIGGQAKFSSRVENYPGFPIGVTGKKLATNMFNQATRLGVEAKLGTRVVGLAYDPATGMKVVTLSDGHRIEARAVIIAGGVEFRKLEFEGSDHGNVVYADGEKLKKLSKGKPVVVIGGSNGAAQAALGVAQNAKHVYLMSRSTIDKGMSDYQVQAVRNHDKITVIENDEIHKLWTDEKGDVSHITTKSGKKLDVAAVGVFVGSAPETKWLPDQIQRDHGKVVVNNDLETHVPGVYAIGDIRVGSIGRIGAAVGDGQMAERNAFQYFEKMKATQKATA